MINSTRVHRGASIRRWAAGILIAVLAVAPIGVITSARAVNLPSVASVAFAQGYSGYVSISYGVPNVTAHKLTVYSAYSACTAKVSLGPLDFKMSPDLSAATLKAATPCGLVSVKWKGVGSLHVFPVGIYRFATASGHIGAFAFSTPGNRSGELAIGYGI